MTIPRFLGLATPFMLAPLCLAGGGGGHEEPSVLPSAEQGITPLVTALVVFVAVFAILSLKVWPKIVKGLKDRENKIREEIEAAEMARTQARDALEQYQQSLAQARAEAQRMLEQAKAQQQAEVAARKQQMDADLAELRAKAMADIDAARRAALSDIYTQTAELAAAAASRILRREVGAGDQKRLIEESLAQLAGARN
ncbi:MAG: F0F1 ATP synthase subunit B [Phycisphaerae bacterium]|nr:F0F1 ATP synthase subunit B [Phycisphaerae bacterium]